MEKNLLILGAGQYGQVAKEVAESTTRFDKIDFLDDKNPLAIGALNDYPRFAEEYAYAFVAIGNAELRLSLLESLGKAGYTLATLIHPRAYVSPSASLAEGVLVEACAIVNTKARVGKGSFICAGSIVNHHANVAECCQVDCGAVIGADSMLPPKTKVRYNEVY